jgi:hypothetical protein
MLAIWVTGILLAGPSPAVADNAPQAQVTTPPARPLPITTEQLLAINQVCHQAEHAPAAYVRAAYSPETARKMQQIGVHVTQAILPSVVLGLLIAAAPL